MSKELSIGFPLGEVDQTIPARFEKIVSMAPDSLAVSHNELHLTYDHFNRLANHVAHALIHHLGKKSELQMPRTNHE